MSGKFINIEGLDGCGKSTHVKLLAQWLRSRGYDILVTDEPTDGQIGVILKRIISGDLRVPIAAEALLFAADRLEHLARVIQPAVQAGKIVLNERYTPSSIAYQSARGLSVEWIRMINKRASEPDLTILIEVPVEASFARIKRSRRLDEFESDLKLQRLVRQNYLQIAKREGIKIVDGNRSINEVQTDIRELVSHLL